MEARADGGPPPGGEVARPLQLVRPRAGGAPCCGVVVGGELGGSKGRAGRHKRGVPEGDLPQLRDAQNGRRRRDGQRRGLALSLRPRAVAAHQRHHPRLVVPLPRLEARPVVGPVYVCVCFVGECDEIFKQWIRRIERLCVSYQNVWNPHGSEWK